MKHTEGRLRLREAHPDCKFYRELGHDDSEKWRRGRVTRFERH
jgi:hypothetical protein